MRPSASQTRLARRRGDAEARIGYRDIECDELTFGEAQRSDGITCEVNGSEEP